jgi:hypothetical protein
MKKITLVFVTTALVLVMNHSYAQAKKSQPKKVVNQVKKEVKKELSPDEEMKIWMDYATPKEMHKVLALSDGNWKAEVTQWMKPNADPTISSGKCNNKMEMEGRYQISTFETEMMGMPFTGMSITAFDNAKEEFISTWIDNFGTGIMVMKGKWDEKTRSIHYKGTMVDPITKKDMPCRQIFTFTEDNAQKMEMFAQRPDGKGEFKTMEIIFTR